MTSDIKVSSKETEDGWELDVTVSDKESETKHKVAMDREYYEQLDTNTPPEEVVRKSFKFLLEREPKEVIYKEFNVEVIGRFFPEYKEESRKF